MFRQVCTIAPSFFNATFGDASSTRPPLFGRHLVYSDFQGKNSPYLVVISGVGHALYVSDFTGQDSPTWRRANSTVWSTRWTIWRVSLLECLRWAARPSTRQQRRTTCEWLRSWGTLAMKAMQELPRGWDPRASGKLGHHTLLVMQKHF